MALFNVRSLSNNTFFINDLIMEHKLDCMFLTETWLSTDGPAALIEASPPNYSSSHSCRQGEKGGGTATILSAAHAGRDIPLGDFCSFEHHAIILRCQPPVLAVTLYRPPKQCPPLPSRLCRILIYYPQ